MCPILSTQVFVEALADWYLVCVCVYPRACFIMSVVYIFFPFGVYQRYHTPSRIFLFFMIYPPDWSLSSFFPLLFTGRVASQRSEDRRRGISRRMSLLLHVTPHSRAGVFAAAHPLFGRTETGSPSRQRDWER